MNIHNKATLELKPEDKELIEKIKNSEPGGGSITYSSKGAANYVKAVQNGEIKELLNNLKK